MNPVIGLVVPAHGNVWVDENKLSENKRLRAAIQAMVDTFDGALLEHDSRNRGGQHVPYHGDFSSIPPSTLSDIRRWSRDLKLALEGKWPMTHEEYSMIFQEKP